MVVVDCQSDWPSRRCGNVPLRKGSSRCVAGSRGRRQRSGIPETLQGLDGELRPAHDETRCQGVSEHNQNPTGEKQRE